MKRTTIAIIAASWFIVGTAHAADPKATPADPKATTTAAPKPVAAATYKVEVKSSRWRKHPRKNYERLVLEFGRKDNGSAASPATPTVVPAASGKEATVVVHGVSLVGDVNEGKIADAYGSKSAFMGTLDILADSSGNGFSMKVGFKKDGVVAEAMWLESPARLVVDVFGSAGDRNAIRASAPDATDADEKVEKAAAAKTAEAAPAAQAPVKAASPAATAGTAANDKVINPEPVAEKKVVGTPNDGKALAAAAAAAAAAATAATTSASTTPAVTAAEPRSIFATPPAKPAKRSRRSQTLGQNLPLPPIPTESHHEAMYTRRDNTDYLCFPASAQVGLSVFFKNKRMASTGEEVRMDIQNTHAKAPSASAIVCYPSTAQVEASISFREDRPMLTGHAGGDSGREPASKK